MIIGGAIYRVPVVLDGFISGAAALAAASICPEISDFLLASHVSAEPAGKMVLDALGLKPAIYGNMCLGEGTEMCIRERFLTTPMRQEVERCRMALEEAAKGRNVSMVCSGDSGVYGMAGLILELAPEYPDVKIQVIPGVTAACAGRCV